ncbi:MAG: 3-phytase, partial [Candidatus Azotimanducaceae bacterium]
QAGLDGVRSSRGFIATANPLPRFPLGLLVVHDQRNRLPDSAENLKLVDWREIIKILNANKTGVDSE